MLSLVSAAQAAAYWPDQKHLEVVEFGLNSLTEYFLSNFLSYAYTEVIEKPVSKYYHEDSTRKQVTY